MNRKLINTFNDIVKPSDQTYFLGDFSFGDPTQWVHLLNGEKFLILGNHDQNYLGKHKKAGWGWVKESHMLETPFKPIYLSHYAHRTWPRASRCGAWHLYGHSHGFLENTPTSMDVGVDPMGFVPISLEQVAARMEAAAPKPDAPPAD